MRVVHREVMMTMKIKKLMQKQETCRTQRYATGSEKKVIRNMREPLHKQEAGGAQRYIADAGRAVRMTSEQHLQ